MDLTGLSRDKSSNPRCTYSGGKVRDSLKLTALFGKLCLGDSKPSSQIKIDQVTQAVAGCSRPSYIL